MLRILSLFCRSYIELCERNDDWNSMKCISHPNHYGNIYELYLNEKKKKKKSSVDSLVNPFPVDAISCGPCWPCDAMLELKSSTAFPNHMRMMRKEVSPS